MLISLHIENYALIDKLSIEFGGGFSTITGETGAGKSILLGAIGLVLGKRADLSSLKNKDEKCVIEAHFNIKDYNLQPFFDENDLDFDEITIIRREILASGKSRAFVNDTPINLVELQELGYKLIDIHSQHQTLELANEDFQFKIIDALANNTKILEDYKAKLKLFKQLQNDKIEKENLLQNLVKEQDYNSFLLNELLAAQLNAGEQETLEQQAVILANVENIKENLAQIIALSDDEQFGISKNLKEVKNVLAKIKSFSNNYESLFERINSVAIEFDDIAKEIQNASEQQVSDPESLQKVNDKLQLIYSLQKKHNVNSVEDLLEIQNDLDQKAISVTEIENQLAKINSQIAEQETNLNELANQLHINREKAVPIFTKNVFEVVEKLGMPNAQFAINLNKTTTFFSNGKDEIEFLFSANKGTSFESLKKVASGGEKSRIMLAIKSIMGEYSQLPTLIFDEIDTGVSGEIADKMGTIMQKMAHNRQLFSITHLPQIAAKGNNQYKVFKTDIENQTISDIKLLSKDERIQEIAQMLSGSTITSPAINQAKALLGLE